MTKSGSPYETAYRGDIDGLRAVAVSIVVLYHAGVPHFTGGYVGVDVFFVISGFLITGILWKDINAGRFSLIDFYSRRARRIFPALFTMLAISSLAAFILLMPPDLSAFGKALNANILFYANYLFLKQSGYFAAPSADNPLLHTWSLSVEEQFYAVWPILLRMMARLPTRNLVLIALFALGAVSLYLAESKVLADRANEAFFMSPHRGWEFMIGAALAIAPFSHLSRRIAAAICASGLGAILLALTCYGADTPFPGGSALLPCLGAALLIAGGSTPNSVSRTLGCWPLRVLGLISYSLYLVHWPLLSFAHLYVNDAPSAAARAALVALSVLLAALSWRYIEVPFRRRASLGGRTVIIAGAAGASALFATGTIFSIFLGFPFRAEPGVISALAAEAQRMPFPQSPNGLSVEFGALGSDTYDLVLWGDSHAAHAIPAMDVLAKRAGLHGAAFARRGCPPFLNSAQTAKPCSGFNTAAAKWIGEQNALQSVVLAARWSLYAGAAGPSLTGNDGESGGLQDLSRTLAFADALKVQTVVLEQVPEYPRPINTCIARALWYGRPADACTKASRAAIEAQSRLAMAHFEALSKRYVFDRVSPIPAFCDAIECRAALGSERWYVDTNHLTEAGALRMVPYLVLPQSAPWLRRAGSLVSAARPSQ